MAEIRRATDSDVQALVALGRQLYLESPNYQDGEFDADLFAHHLSTWMRADESLVLVAQLGEEVVGALIAMLIPHWFNGVLLACEVGLYVAPAHRGTRAWPQLVANYEDWARARGARRCVLGVSTGIHHDRTVNGYQGLGYTLDSQTLSKPCCHS